MSETPKPYAVVAITKHGTAIARRLGRLLPDVDVYYPEKFTVGDEADAGFHAFSGSVVAYVPDLFAAYSGLIGVFSLGAMVRLVAPLLKDKRTDPAILVIDDRAEHVISVLSGHLGGANELTHKVAAVLGARPVITTASDVGQTLAVDLLGRAFGWEIENYAQVTPVSASIVNEERVLIVQEAGELDWWTYDKPLPDSIQLCDSTEQARRTPHDATLIISPRILDDSEAELLKNGILYRPKVVVVGVGCNRGTSAAEIEQVIEQALATAKLSVLCMRNLATIDVKQDEAGLLAVSKAKKWPLVTYTADELNTVKIAHPSATVFQYVGAYGVSEPAARLSSGADGWALEKVKSGNVTVSICVVPLATTPTKGEGVC
jgi:cobalt-precorrin 5A hydrolase